MRKYDRVQYNILSPVLTLSVCTGLVFFVIIVVYRLTPVNVILMNIKHHLKIENCRIDDGDDTRISTGSLYIHNNHAKLEKWKVLTLRTCIVNDVRCVAYALHAEYDALLN